MNRREWFQTPAGSRLRAQERRHRGRSVLLAAAVLLYVWLIYLGL